MSKQTSMPISAVAAATGAFVLSMVRAASESSGNSLKLDSAAANDFVNEAKSRSVGDVKAVPDSVLAVMDEFNQKGEFTKAILDSAAEYKRQHNAELPADLAAQVMHSAFSLTTDGLAMAQKNTNFVHLDSATESASNPLSLQPNRAVVAVYATVAEAIPFAHYLPADIGSNEARLGIMTHNAGSATGAYAKRDLMDGTHAGRRFLSALRTHSVSPDADGLVGGKLTNTQTSRDTCDQNANGVKTLRGRLQVYCMGKLVGEEVARNSTGTNAVTGKIVIGSNTYEIGGTHNPDTGVFALTTSPKLPTSHKVTVTAPIDFEQQPDLAAHTGVSVEMFKLFAVPVRGIVRVGPDSQTQISNELGLDTFGESVLMLHRQWAIERHFDALHMLRQVGQNNADTYDFNWDGRSTDMTRAKIWGDFPAKIAERSQIMVEATQDHGITHLYVGKQLMSQWLSLPRDIFTPSGVAPRAGIFRFGNLGGYECYYDPEAVENIATGTAQVLAIGRATQAARNPIVLGDAVAPAVMPLSRGDDLKNGAGFYGRSFTEINPHGPSAVGAALIDITGLK